jgi:predicted TPR repeat methyltransferase
VNEELRVEQEIRAGYLHLTAGAPAAALACFDRALRLDPGSSEVQAARAAALADLDRPLDAADAYAQALRLDPDCQTYRWMRIEHLLRGGAPATAAEEAESAICAGAPSARLHALAARAYCALDAKSDPDRLGRALHHYETALALDPESRDLRLETALVALEAHRLPIAIGLLERARRDHPGDLELLVALARVKAAALETEQARALLLRCIEEDPADSLGARSLLAEIDASREARAAGAALPEAYVRALFDQYADRFDDALRRDLQYRGPEAVAELLDPYLSALESRDSHATRAIGAGRHGGLSQRAAGREPPEPTPSGAEGGSPARLDILDLGCGTGLSGERFRACARRLDGVDLSPRMIERARRRGWSWAASSMCFADRPRPS